MMNEYDFLVSYLKTHPNSTLTTIMKAYELANPFVYGTKIADEVDKLKKRNLIVEDENHALRFHQILDPIPKKHVGFYQTAVPEEAPTSSKFVNPQIHNIAQRIQGDRGTCVGQGCANVKDLLYSEINKITEEDKLGYKRDVTDPDGVIHDILYWPSSSAECIYQKSRELGHVTAPSGSYTYLGLSALTKLGTCFEDNWPTSKTSRCVLREPRAEQKEEALLSMYFHKLDGYSQLINKTFDATKAAIEKYGCVASSFTIYENYGSMEGGDGTFPEPKGEVIGGHCLCLYGYDENYIYCLHTWGDWCGRFGKISRNYFSICCNDVFIPLDKEEAVRMKETYVKITCYSDIRANFYLIQNGVKKYIGTYPDAPVSLQLKVGIPVIFYAEAVQFFNRNVEIEYTPQKEGLFIVKLSAPQEPDGLRQAILAWLRKVFYK